MRLQTPQKCGILRFMANLIRQFELECSEAGISPTQALKAGGVHDSLWWKWKEDKVSPTLRSFEKARAGLLKLRAAANDDTQSAERAA